MYSQDKRIICVKNLPYYSERTVYSLFGKFGNIISYKFVDGVDSNNKDVIIEFDSDHSAIQAQKELHSRTIGDAKLYVNFASPEQYKVLAADKPGLMKPNFSALGRIIDPKDVKDQMGGNYSQVHTPKKEEVFPFSMSNIRTPIQSNSQTSGGKLESKDERGTSGGSITGKIEKFINTSPWQEKLCNINTKSINLESLCLRPGASTQKPSGMAGGLEKLKVEGINDQKAPELLGLSKIPGNSKYPQPDSSYETHPDSFTYSNQVRHQDHSTYQVKAEYIYGTGKQNREHDMYTTLDYSTKPKENENSDIKMVIQQHPELKTHLENPEVFKALFEVFKKEFASAITKKSPDHKRSPSSHQSGYRSKHKHESTNSKRKRHSRSRSHKRSNSASSRHHRHSHKKDRSRSRSRSYSPKHHRSTKNYGTSNSKKLHYRHRSQHSHSRSRSHSAYGADMHSDSRHRSYSSDASKRSPSRSTSNHDHHRHSKTHHHDRSSHKEHKRKKDIYKEKHQKRSISKEKSNKKKYDRKKTKSRTRSRSYDDRNQYKRHSPIKESTKISLQNKVSNYTEKSPFQTHDFTINACIEKGSVPLNKISEVPKKEEPLFLNPIQVAHIPESKDQNPSYNSDQDLVKADNISFKEPSLLDQPSHYHPKVEGIKKHVKVEPRLDSIFQHLKIERDKDLSHSSHYIRGAEEKESSHSSSMFDIREPPKRENQNGFVYSSRIPANKKANYPFSQDSNWMFPHTLGIYPDYTTSQNPKDYLQSNNLTSLLTFPYSSTLTVKDVPLVLPNYVDTFTKEAINEEQQISLNDNGLRTLAQNEEDFQLAVDIEQAENSLQSNPFLLEGDEANKNVQMNDVFNIQNTQDSKSILAIEEEAKESSIVQGNLLTGESMEKSIEELQKTIREGIIHIKSYQMNKYESYQSNTYEETTIDYNRVEELNSQRKDSKNEDNYQKVSEEIREEQNGRQENLTEKEHDNEEKNVDSINPQQVKQESSITNDFIKKNNLEGFVKFIMTGGDVNSLREKLKTMGAPL